MTTTNHTPIPATKRPANASTFNAPLAELDAAIGDLTALTSDVKTSAVTAINSILDGATFSGALVGTSGTFSGTLQAAVLLGNGAGLTGITGATGGVANTGSTTIGADTDADTVGEIALQTASTTKLLITNGGNLKGSNDVICLGYSANAYEADVHSSVIAGGGQASGPYENHLRDTYTARAVLMTISGGGNNIIDSGFPSVIAGGAHNRINVATPPGSWWTNNKDPHTPADKAGHATIGGGSKNAIYNGEYGVISGGTDNSIASTGGDIFYATIGGGWLNKLDGLYGVIGGGWNNTLTGEGATIGGGVANTTSASYATIAGGNANTASDAGTFVAGRTNTASADYAAIPGGRANTASGDYSTASGYYAVADQYGELARASGRFAADGDAQAMQYIVRRQTTDATPATLLFGDAATYPVLPNDSTWTFTARIVGRRTDANDTSAGYIISGVIDRNADAASTALVGSLDKTLLAEDDSDWDATAEANGTGGGLAIKVTGKAGQTINWVAVIDVVQVTG